jgi:hypothetical protein
LWENVRGLNEHFHDTTASGWMICRQRKQISFRCPVIAAGLLHFFLLCPGCMAEEVTVSLHRQHGFLAGPVIVFPPFPPGYDSIAALLTSKHHAVSRRSS